MPDKRIAWLAWTLCALVAATAVLGIVLTVAGRSQSLVWFTDALTTGLAIPFAIVAALIISRQPRNAVGWLLLLPSVLVAFESLSLYYLATLPAAPDHVAWPLLLLIWSSSWTWLLLVFPLLLIPLFFPTGRPASRRWRWVAIAAAAEAAIFMFLATFQVRLEVGTDNSTLSVPNPIGFLPEDLVNSVIGVWIVGLVSLTLLCVASLFVRYRRAGAVERTQIRWLLYACLLFALVYVTGFFINMDSPTGGWALASYVWNLAFALTIVAIYAAIAIAILRYRLYDIDLIIRRTLVYGVLTAVLALIYFGSVILLQGVFTAVIGRLSAPSGLWPEGTGPDAASRVGAVVVVASTLAIAALFAPVRRRVQAFIDRRFYRRKYDAAQTLAEFSTTARDQTNLTELTGRLVAVVDETMQPAQVSLWLNEPGSPRSG